MDLVKMSADRYRYESTGRNDFVSTIYVIWLLYSLTVVTQKNKPKIIWYKTGEKQDNQ